MNEQFKEICREALQQQLINNSIHVNEPLFCFCTHETPLKSIMCYQLTKYENEK